MAFAGRNSTQFTLRVPEQLHQQVKAATEKSGRSMNSEIVFLISQALERSTGNEKSGTTA